MVALKLKEFDIDTLPLAFGKYKGNTPNEVSVIDPHYLVWMYENIPNICSRDCYMNAEQDAQEINTHAHDLDDVAPYSSRR